MVTSQTFAQFVGMEINAGKVLSGLDKAFSGIIVAMLGINTLILATETDLMQDLIITFNLKGAKSYLGDNGSDGFGKEAANREAKKRNSPTIH